MGKFFNEVSARIFVRVLHLQKDSVSIRFRPHKILLFFAFPLHLLSYFR